MTQKIDARAVTSNMLYDSLNRVTETNYTSGPTNTPTSRYCYDGKIFDTATGLCQTASPAICPVPLLIRLLRPSTNGTWTVEIPTRVYPRSLTA